MNDTEPAVWISDLIKNFINESPGNSLAGDSEDSTWTKKKAWADPLAGFANGADPIFEEYKNHVGDFHWTPAEIFAETYPGLSFSPDELAVISWILPQTEATKREHGQAAKLPPESWIRSRIFGEKINEKLRRHVVDSLHQAGFEALAPVLTPDWKTMPSERYYLASKWSERHAAYAAGLGTFGLCDGLITPRGKAIRAGSVIARIPIQPTQRPYDHHRAYCLFYTENACGDCIPRCPVGALSENGHDKRKCNHYIQKVVAKHVEENFGFPGRGGCGLCQTGVPCESKIPSLDDL